MTRTAWFLLLALAIVWGVPYYLIKIALTDFGPAWIALGRVILGGILLIGFVPRNDWVALRPRAGAIVAVALTDTALPFYLIGKGEGSVSSSLTGILLSAMPITVWILARIVDRRERVTRSQIFGLGLGMLGVVVLVGFDVGLDTNTLGGVMLIAGATLSYSVGILMIKRWLRDVPMLATTTAILGVAAVMLAPAAFTEPITHLPGTPALAAIAVLGLVCTAAAYVMYFALIERTGALQASVVAYLNPAVAAVLGVALLHESVHVTTVAGLLLVIAGSWLSAGGPRPPAQPAALQPRFSRTPVAPSS